jgi:very-short-patch-repair endonuclease
LEARALEVIRSAGLPEPVRQLDIGDANGWVGRVDLAYPDRRLVIEVDSDIHHSTLVDRRADELRDHRLRSAGWTVARITEVELARPGSVADRLRALLSSTAA